MADETDAPPDEPVDVEEHGKKGTRPPPGRRYRVRVDKQHVIFDTQVVTGREILEKVGKDPTRFRLDQKLHGGKTVKIEPDDKVDLTTPGLERFMTLPLDAREGSAPAELILRREFQLPEDDLEHLEARGLRWETVIEGKRRWLLIHDFPVPEGYRVSRTSLALLLPASYPTSQIDMFFVHPVLELTSGRAIRKAESRMLIGGVSYQRWSRHRTNANPWRADVDNLATHLGLVEECLAREVGLA